MAGRFQARSHGLDRFLPPETEADETPTPPEPLKQEGPVGPEPAPVAEAPVGKKRPSPSMRAKPRAVMVFLRREDEDLLERERQRRLRESTRRRGRTEVSTLIRDAIRATYGQR